MIFTIRLANVCIMLNVKGVVISDEVQEAIYDATDLYGVYEFDLDIKLRDVIYVVGVAHHSISEMIEAQEYLNRRCPEFRWYGALYSWDMLARSVPVFTSSLWFGEGDEYGTTN